MWLLSPFESVNHAKYWLPSLLIYRNGFIMLLYFLFSWNGTYLFWQICFFYYNICDLWPLWQRRGFLKPPFAKTTLPIWGFLETGYWEVLWHFLFDFIILCTLSSLWAAQTVGFNHLVQKTCELYMICCKLLKGRNYDSFICTPHGIGQSAWHIPRAIETCFESHLRENKLNTQLDIH